MLSIGEFSKICKVSTKTLRYYAEIGLILPSEINPENGYRYYAIEQLDISNFLFLSCLIAFQNKRRIHQKNYPLEPFFGQKADTSLVALIQKRDDMKKQLYEQEKSLRQLECDISNLKNGKPIMSYLDDIDVELVELPFTTVFRHNPALKSLVPITYSLIGIANSVSKPNVLNSLLWNKTIGGLAMVKFSFLMHYLKYM